MKNFLELRINWITNNIGSFSDCLNPEVPPLVITKINYAPDTSVVYPVSNDLEFIEISNTGDEAVNLTGIYFSGTGFVYKFNADRIVEPHGIDNSCRQFGDIQGKIRVLSVWTVYKKSFKYRRETCARRWFRECDRYG